jgi:hypothetical protein
MILLTDDVLNAITILKKSYGSAEKMVSKEAKDQKPVENSNDFQDFSNLVYHIENVPVTVENLSKMARFTSKVVIRGLLKKLPDYFLLQLGQYLVQVWTKNVKIHQFAICVQTEIVSKADIGDEIAQTMAVKSYKNFKKSYSNAAPTNNRMCQICRNGEPKPLQCDKYNKGDIISRWMMADNHRLCFNCKEKHAIGKRPVGSMVAEITIKCYTKMT